MSMLVDAKKQLEKSLPYAKVDPETWEILQYPQRTIQASLPVRLDNGDLRLFKALRVQHNNSRGAFKGGIRYYSNASIDETSALAFFMTFKTATAKLPWGGAKGSISVNTKELSHRELERLSKAYIDAFADFIGPDIDIPAPDLYTNEKIMGWMYAEYKKLKGGNPRDVITGKPVPLGGIENRISATGHGGYYVWDYLSKHYFGSSIAPKRNLRVAIQGFGQVGYYLAEKLHSNDFKVVALSNEFGGTYSSKGLNVPRCRRSLESSDGKDWGEGEKITNTDLLTMDTDLLCLAAIENVVTEANAKSIQAKVILELANGPITFAADEILSEKNIVVIPDLLANSGGVIVSYFEWLQNRSAEIRSSERVEADLKEMMEDATKKMLARHLEHKIPMRTATYALALKRIGDASECLGTRNYFRS